jgi:hypothetical protein
MSDRFNRDIDTNNALDASRERGIKSCKSIACLDLSAVHSISRLLFPF